MEQIALEGIDGAGKSTQIKRLSERLTIDGYPTALWHYTSKDNLWGRLIKRIYADNPDSSLDFIRESRCVQELLYALSSRANLNKIEDRIKADTILISDRSIISAYASHIDKLPPWFIDLVEPKIIPDLAIFLDIPPEEGMRRIQGRNTLLLDENLEELVHFRNCYERIMGQERPKSLQKTRFVKVDGTLPEREVADSMYEIVRTELKGGNYNGCRQV